MSVERKRAISMRTKTNTLDKIYEEEGEVV